MNARPASSAPRPARPQVPTLFAVLALIAAAYLLTPILALGLRVPWTQLGRILLEPGTRELLRLTLTAAVLSSALALVLGVSLAVWIQSFRRGGQIARLLVLLPLAMPPVVSGLALSAAVGNRGVLQPLLDALGLQFAFQFPGVVVAHTFVSLPFVIVTVDSALRQIDREIPASAAGVGMRPREVLRRIILPTIAPAIATGTGLAFARSLGEFGTTITFAGSMPGVTRTMSLAIYLEREVDRDTAYALSAILIILAVGVLALASVPALLRRDAEPLARAIGPLDTHRLRDLTRPGAGGEEVTVDGTVFPADRISAVVGPNGSGKSTLMGLIAGRLRGAEVRIGQRGVDGGDRFVPAHERGVVLLTQRPGLPRFTTVLGALDMVTRDRRRSRELLDAAGLTDLGEVTVAALSGGQAAQVALVRALATRPRVLILDEPLAAVDVASAARWRRLLRATAADRTTILVTHDPLDVAGLSDRLVVVDGGRVVAAGPTDELLNVPPNDFLAEIAGLNRLTGFVSEKSSDNMRVNSHGLDIQGVLSEGVDPGSVTVGDQAIVTVAPEAITLRLPGHDAGIRESARNVWPATVVTVTAASAVATQVVVDLTGGGRLTVPVTRASALDLELGPGIAVECVTKALSVVVHPRG
ncbi:ATP-binding cassette domain-containing protein [Corynebacterium guangdongense]|uniref:Molybdate transport system permease protein n=1 Tax=Corynebacterium guangdongense TaxID=1783348 RepID=A0ABU1ZWF2_9CORY|nr:ATP-binding cassette domain-containing protein [Corynebacterium guangdongense]MDR7329090.1 molybdate transport system permease protein [Corynebacterium guangdongense]WJZ17659.1 Sulfate/thiosulfate import ATP-binding protein CysA [Corynebacterium guangdongense]